MANLINIKKGLQIPLQGASEEVLRGSVTSEFVRICPEDFHGITPKLAVKVDDRVKAGNALFYAKDHPEILFASPVSGVVTEVERGEKRRILNIVIKADSEIEYEDFGVKKVTSLSPEEIKKSILDAGMWFLIKQRPYDVVAVP
ncbi:MAG: NADH:ubiquinone reductase (Na(+)-transporting) subunit A, partial [Fermentimonas sp.]|nr:NADH:ubiquinone reductase (Na(+)-transporting) subunit A [Fermentimonas sp.]